MWVYTDSVIAYSGKLQQDDILSLEDIIYYQQNKVSAKFKGTWTLLEDGRVRQLFEEYDAKAKMECLV